MTEPDFAGFPDLASRALGGSVVYANDELFAQRENLINPEAPRFSATDFGHKGKVYDGWESRRRREPGFDFAIVRLGVAGIVRGVVVDTSWFTGNHPPYISIDGAGVEGYPSPERLLEATWHPLVGRSAVRGDTQNLFEVTDGRRFTHVRLCIHPDGGVARLRVHGAAVPDPRCWTDTFDLAALENGGDIVDCSDQFYSSPRNILLPGRAGMMGDGWENARRRDGGNDHVTVRLGAPGLVELVEVDTSYFVGNAAGWVTLRGADGGAGQRTPGEKDWSELVPRTRLQPDTRHFFRVDGVTPVSHVRLDVFPDGGLARLRVHGRLTASARDAATRRWLDLLPPDHAERVRGADRPDRGAGSVPDAEL